MFTTIVSEYIVSHFPGSRFEKEDESRSVYMIFHGDNKLLALDNQGVNYFFPNRYPNNRWSWDGIIEGSPDAIAEIILKDLADHGLSTFNRFGRKIFARTIKLDGIECPKCGSKDSIKRYFFGRIGTSNFAIKLMKDRIPIGRSRRRGDPEAFCNACSWTGSTEIFRFRSKES
jgi:hypothetical protein